MKIWYNNIIDTERHVVDVQGDRIGIGRASRTRSCSKVRMWPRRRRSSIAAGRVGARGAGHERRLARRSPAVRRRALRNPRQPDDFALPLFAHAGFPEGRRDDREHQRQLLDEKMSGLIRDVHVELLRRMDLTSDSAASSRTTMSTCRGWSERSTTSPAATRSSPAAARRWWPTWLAMVCATGCWSIDVRHRGPP